MGYDDIGDNKTGLIMTHKLRSEYVYKDLELRMSKKQMSEVMYAGIFLGAGFPTLWTLSPSGDQKRDCMNHAHIKVHIHPDCVEQFEELTGLKLVDPPKVGVN